MITKSWLARFSIALAGLLVLETASAAAQGLVRSFSDLQHRLTVGQRVSIIEQHGSVTTVTKGKVVSITRDALEIRLPGPVFLVRGKTYVAGESSVSRIESAHHIWKGAAIGVAAGVLTVLALERSGGAMHPEEKGFMFAWIPVMGGYAGYRIEEKMQHRLIYLSPARMPASLPRTPRRPFIGATVRF